MNFRFAVWCQRSIRTTSARNFSSSLSSLNVEWKKNLKLYKDNFAIIQDDYKITYDELDHRINSLCYMLKHEYHLQKNDKLLHLSGTRIDDLQILIACARSGIIYMPINPFSESQVINIIKTTQPKLIINEPEFNRLIPNNDINKIVLTQEFDPNNWLSQQYENTASIDNYSDNVYGKDKHHVIFTSGTTGAPKGCVYSHHSVYGSIGGFSKYDDPTISDKDYTLITTSLIGAIGALQRWSVLLEGNTMIYPNKHKFKDVSHWNDLCENKYPQISKLLIFGKAISDICTLRKPFNNLKSVIYCGDFTPSKIVWYLKNNIFASNTKLIHHYGLSEALLCSLLDPNVLDEIINKQSMNMNLNLPVGTPINDKVLIKINNDGEIIVNKKDRSSMIEYLNADELTSNVMTYDGWIKTGDLGYIDDDGLLYLLGRKKDVIKNDVSRCIYPIDIENIILSHSDIDEVAVVGYPNSLQHESSTGQVPVAFVVCNNTKNHINDKKKELMKLCRKSLDPAHMVKEIFFVDTLPQTPARKTDKKLLQQKIVDGEYRICYK